MTTTTTEAGAPALTARQREVHGFMLRHQAERGMPPTIREIAAAIGVSSPNGVRGHLNAIVRKGLATRREMTARGVLAIADDAGRSPCCPACGRPFGADDGTKGIVEGTEATDGQD